MPANVLREQRGCWQELADEVSKKKKLGPETSRGQSQRTLTPLCPPLWG